EPSSIAPKKMMIAPYWGGNPTVKAIVYNIENAAEPKLVREVELEGSLLTSRKVGNHIYLLSNQYLYPARPLPAQMRDTAISEEFTPIGMDKVQYFPGGTYSSYLLIAAFDLNAIEKGSVTEAFLGAGNNVYMSEENLYISIPKGQDETAVYRFAVDKANVEFRAKGSVPGNILNQFSMDEHKGHLRIATTSRTKENGQLNNNVYVLDGEMKTVGKVEGIAPNERIYSARFMGDKGYMVTFELVDPLFVLDLSKPNDPKILGALKIPGFSSYLHPLDDNHLLGIGRDTDVIERKDASGKILGRPFAIEKGIKLAIFDVRDLSNPIEKFSTIIGARGSQAEVLQNHKALYYENGLLGFALNETKPAAEPTGYGSFAFQGAVLYDVSLEKGFEQLGKITHLDNDTYLKMGQYWHGSDAEIRRIIRVSDKLYIISNRFITAHDIKTLELVRKVELAQQ
ncbi:MAG: beta-propeller domain-containing protein, partial [Bacillota bacterium]